MNDSRNNDPKNLEAENLVLICFMIRRMQRSLMP